MINLGSCLLHIADFYNTFLVFVCLWLKFLVEMNLKMNAGSKDVNCNV